MLLRYDKRDNPIAFGIGEIRSICTILVSKTSFSEEEVQRLAADANAAGGEVMAAPGVPPRDPVLAQLLSSATRRAAVATSPFNIAPPTDLQPYFSFNAVSLLEQMDSPIGRVLIVGGVVAAVGFILGCALPLGPPGHSDGRMGDSEGVGDQ